MSEAAAPIRLTFVYPQLKRLTGAQRLILQLAATLDELGHEVTLVTHRVAPACRTALAPGVRLIETGRRLDWTGRHVVDSALEYLLGIGLARRLPPAEATVFFGPPSLPALAVARRRGCRPVITFCYEPPRFAYADRALIAGRFGMAAPLMAGLFRLYRPIDHWLIGQADLVCANGRFGAGEIERVYRRPALVLDHGVALPPPDPAARARLARRLRLTDRPVLLTVNHLHPRKRLDLFLETLALVLKQRPDALGVIAGEGVDRARLETAARRLGLDRGTLRWAGFVAEEELAALYGLATVYLHTAQRESFGLSVLEAAAAGLPVVAVDEGGPRDILDYGRLGRLTEARPEALASATLDLLASPDEAARLGEAAALAARARFQWRAGAKALVAAVRAMQQGLEGDQVAAQSRPDTVRT